MRGELSRADLSRFQPTLLARKKSQIIKSSNERVMVGITQSLLEAFADFTLESFRHGRGSAGGMESDHWTKAPKVKVFRLGERFDFDELTASQHARGFHVFVDESFHREHKLVFERRPRLFR